MVMWPTKLGWPAFRFPSANTSTSPSPRAAKTSKWISASLSGSSIDTSFTNSASVKVMRRRPHRLVGVGRGGEVDGHVRRRACQDQAPIADADAVHAIDVRGRVAAAD